jgi:hypothetical protein
MWRVVEEGRGWQWRVVGGLEEGRGERVDD